MPIDPVVAIHAANVFLPLGGELVAVGGDSPFHLCNISVNTGKIVKSLYKCQYKQTSKPIELCFVLLLLLLLLLLRNEFVPT